MKEIILVIGNDGSLTLEGEHYSGPTCDKELRELAESLGVIESVEKKPEYFQTAQNTAAVKQGVR